MAKTAMARLKDEIRELKTDKGWVNVLTNLGVPNKDKRTGAKLDSNFLSQGELESLYQADDVAARIIDIPPNEMTREGFDILFSDQDPTLADFAFKELNRLGAKGKFRDALKFARLYGGAGIIIGSADGRKAYEPLELEKIKRVDYLTVLDRHRLTSIPDFIEKDVSKENYGYPNFYKVVNTTNTQVTEEFSKIHFSRIIRFNGHAVPVNLRSYVDYWGDTVLNRLYNAIRNFQTVNDTAALVIQDFTQLIVKLKNLHQMLVAGDDQLVTKRLQLLAWTSSVVNAAVVMDGEEVERKSTNVTGLAELIRLVNNRLVSATDIPHTMLLGESPSGLGASGDSEKRDFYDYIRNQQEDVLESKHRQIINAIFAQKNGETKGKIPNYEVKYKPLWQMSLKERQEAKKIQSDVDRNYFEIGALDADEIARSRFATAEFSFETFLNAGKRKSFDEPIEEPDNDSEAI